jgi:crossover junction endodeoxyribonuclease RuvC
MTRTIAAVDPGLTGALAVLFQDDEDKVYLLGVHDLPTAQAKQGKTIKSHLLLPAFADMLKTAGPMSWAGLSDGDLPDEIVIEEVGAMPGQGVTSMFRFGYTAGAIAGVAAGLQIPVNFIRPNVWYKTASVRPGPDAGRLRANQLFPKQATLFARKKDHNRADAVLIGYAHLCQTAGKQLRTV